MILLGKLLPLKLQFFYSLSRVSQLKVYDPLLHNSQISQVNLHLVTVTHAVVECFNIMNVGVKTIYFGFDEQVWQNSH